MPLEQKAAGLLFPAFYPVQVCLFAILTPVKLFFGAWSPWKVGSVAVTTSDALFVT